MTTLKALKRTPKFQFSSIIGTTKSVTYPFYCIFRKLPKFFNFSDGMAYFYVILKKPFYELKKKSTE